MPLSEHEQRLLEEMERSLYHNDGDFVAAVGGHRSRPAYRAIVLGVLLGVLGVAGLVVGVILQLAIVGILGFVVMFGGVLLAITPRRGAPGATPPSAGPAPHGNAQPRFMDKLNDRWDKRQDGHS